MEVHRVISLLLLTVSTVLCTEQLLHSDCGSHSKVSSAILVPSVPDVNGAYMVREGQNYSLTVVFQSAKFQYPGCSRYACNTHGCENNQQTVVYRSDVGMPTAIFRHAADIGPIWTCLLGYHHNFSRAAVVHSEENFDSLTFTATGILPLSNQEFDLALDRSPCSTQLSCPLSPGPTYSYTATTTVIGLSGSFTTFDIRVRLYETSNGRNVFCFLFPGHAMAR